MVKIAIAGASGEVAREIIDALIASEKHNLILLTRKDISIQPILTNSTWHQVDYSDKPKLEQILSGVHTLFSFITPQTDPSNTAQKNLIDICIPLGVKRFAPSEWATSSVEYMPWYAGKAFIRSYLQDLNKNGLVLEYSLFQPGLFLNYLTHPHPSAAHVKTFATPFDFENRRMIVPKGCESVRISLTTVQDLAAIVVKAVEYEGIWPVIGGVKGCSLTLGELVKLGEEVRGEKFEVEGLDIEDLEAGIVKSTWIPKVNHPAIPAEQADALAEIFLAGMMLGVSAGALDVSDEWNQLFPEYNFTQPKKFLLKVWEGKA